MPFYAFPYEIRRLVYTTNAIDALNSKLRRAVRARGRFPTNEAALKLLFLVLSRSQRKRTMPARKWCMVKGPVRRPVRRTPHASNGLINGNQPAHTQKLR